MRPPELSVVIAVFNEEEVLPELYRRLTAALQTLGRSYEVILVDDGSRDRSLEILQSLQTRDPAHIRVLSFTRNFGHHIALTAGLDQAMGDIVVMMDADLQDQPEEIHKLLDKIDEGYDVVWGERETRQFAWYKNLSSQLFLWLMNSVARAEVHLDSSIFRAMRRSVANDLKGLREKARYLPGLVRWLGYRQTSVPVVHGKRFAGQTKYSLWKLIKLALATATSFSAAPLQLATLSGMTAAGIAGLSVIYILIRKLLGGYTVPGYASIMIAIFVFGALQLIVIGLMGEYISRIYREAQGRPLYVLRDLTNEWSPRALSQQTEPKTVLKLSQNEIGEIISFLSSDPHLPMSLVIPGGSNTELAEYHWNSWLRSDPSIFTQRGEKGLTALSILQHLEFDTRILGVPSARVLYANSAPASGVESGRLTAFDNVLSQTLAFAREKQYGLIDARVSNQDLYLMRGFEELAFHTVDMLVTLGASREKIERILTRHPVTFVNDSYEFPPSLRIRMMRAEDVGTLAAISKAAFSDHSMVQDRFFLEPSIDQDKASDIFYEWVVNLAKKHTAGDGVLLVAEIQGVPVGFLGIEPMAPFGSDVWWKDSLNAVAPEARGHGVYRALVLAALDYVQKMNGAGLITKTQSSTYRVINTWLHLGCDILENFATLHWTPSTISRSRTIAS